MEYILEQGSRAWELIFGVFQAMASYALRLDSSAALVAA